MQFGFGAGSLFGINNSSANNTPQNFGALQDVSVDISFSLKELRGRFQMPLTVARGAGKIQCKAKTGNISANTFNELFFGQSLATGQTLTAINEASVIPSTPYQVTVSNTATFTKDLGVCDGTTGVALKKVASAPTTGQYSVSVAGVYTFAAADTGKAVVITYNYTAATGNTITLTNQLMGASPVFTAVLTEIYDGKTLTLTLVSCTSSKLTMATKLEDFVIPELDFEAYANAAGSIGTLSLTE